MTVSKGLHLFGKLQLKTDERYYATVNLLDNMQIQTVIHLKPLKFGEITRSKHGKPSYQNINLFLYSGKDQFDSGPQIVVGLQSQYLRGYAILLIFNIIAFGHQNYLGLLLAFDIEK